MNRTTLHSLVDRIPEQELAAAERYLQFLSVSASQRAANAAPLDDEPVTQGDADAMHRAAKDVEAGRIATHDEVLREFGLR